MKILFNLKLLIFWKSITNTTKRGSLPEEASIHTAKMTAIKIALKWKTKEDSSLQSIKHNKKICKVDVPIEIKGNEESNKAENKQ